MLHGALTSALVPNVAELDPDEVDLAPSPNANESAPKALARRPKANEFRPIASASTPPANAFVPVAKESCPKA